MMKAPLIIAGLLLISPLLARGQDAATQPTTQSAAVVDPPADLNEQPAGPGVTPGSTSPEDPRAHRRGMYPRVGQRAAQQLTEKELDDARKFMEQHSPQRLKALEAMPDGEEKTRIRTGAALAYLNWMRLANTDFELYSVTVKRIDLEDQIFGKFAQMRTDVPDKQDADKAELKDLVAKLVDNGIQERHLRLDRLKTVIDKEAKTLEHDESNRSQVVDDRMKAILNSDGGGLLPNPGPGGVGAGAGGGDKHPHGGHGN